MNEGDLRQIKKEGFILEEDGEPCGIEQITAFHRVTPWNIKINGILQGKGHCRAMTD